MIAVILIFITVVSLIGLLTLSKIHGQAKNYIVAGKSLPLWIAAFTLAAQSFDSNASLGNSAFAFADGFWAGAILPLGLATALFLTGKFFAEPLNKMNLLTLPDYYNMRYGRLVEFLVSILTVISFVILLAGNLAGIGILFQYILGVPYALAVTLMAALILAYTMAGGLFSVAWTDVIQISIAVIGFVAGFIWLVGAHGIDLLVSAVETKFSLEPLFLAKDGALINWAGFLALGLGDIVALDFMERVFSAKSAKVAKRACYIAGGFTIVAGLAATFIGMMASNFYNPEIGGTVLLQLASDNLPFAVGGLILIGIIGASMSTADGAILATSTVVSRNIIQPNFPKLIEKIKLLPLSRLAGIPITAFAVWFAIIRPEPGILLILAFDVVFAGCLVPLIFGLYWKKATTAAAVWSIILGTSSRLILHFTIPENLAGLDTLIPPIISLIVFVSIASLRKQQEGDYNHPQNNPVIGK